MAIYAVDAERVKVSAGAVGAAVEFVDGVADGDFDGAADGAAVGYLDGAAFGSADGAVGAVDGDVDGSVDADVDGAVGRADGAALVAVDWADGAALGAVDRDDEAAAGVDGAEAVTLSSAWNPGSHHRPHYGHFLWSTMTRCLTIVVLDQYP